MTLRQLEVLRALIRYHTTVAAARDLGMSQPAVSNALKAMESQVGFALFERVNNRLLPTVEAVGLYKEAESIFALHRNLEMRVQDLRESRSGHLRIVATPPLGYGIVPPALSHFLTARPGVRVHFDVRRYEGVVEGVITGVAELGFALGLTQHPGVASEIVDRGEMVCVLAPDHPLAELSIVSPKDLSAFPFIALERGTRLGEAVRDSFERASTPFRFNVEVRYCNTACVLAAARVGASVVDPFSPYLGGSHNLVIRRFTPQTPAIAYVLWSEAQPLSRLGRAFLAEIRVVARRRLALPPNGLPFGKLAGEC